jgi:flagellar hook-associated protein 1 FlgK
MSLLSIGKTGLYAAQTALSTTGHNISNANTPGYSRQVVVQASAVAMAQSFGSIGTGTKVADVKRYSDEFLNMQVRTAQASASAFDSYQAQINQVDNLLADTTSGLSPALQDFFSSVQNLTGDRAGLPSRGTLLTSAQTLASRFQQMNGRLQEIRDGVNTEITTSVTQINTYASQIAELNDKIGQLSAGSSQGLPNDLLDQRDQLIMDLNKQVKATVLPGDNNSLTVSIGTGQPLVIGKNAYPLAATTSPTDQSRVEVGLVTGDKVTVLSDTALPGGALGGVLDFRTNTLDQAQNALGRVAIGMAQSFNDQHKLGVDANGNYGTDFFTVGAAFIGKNVNNNPTSTTQITATVSDASKLTLSDYRVDYDGKEFAVTRLSDNTKTIISPYPQSTPQTIDGIDFAISGSADVGDNFLVRPTINGAADFDVAIKDVSQIAAAAPIATSAPLTNTGTGTISEGSVDKSYLSNKLSAPLTLSYNAATGTIGGFPATQPVTVVAGGITTQYAAGAAVPFTTGASYTVGGMNFTLNGMPGSGDQFVISPSAAAGDTRNASLLGDLQTTNIFNNGTATYQSAYANLVSTVGNKAREVQANSDAASALLAQTQSAAQNVSGVNLDEEAANLLKYQQAYQASAKVMQIADTIFNALLSINQ